MGKMSRDKGARFERSIVKRLAKWWGSEFQRTPQSGGSQLANGWNLAGDVCTPDETFPFHVECKHVEGWDLSHLLTSKEMGLFGKWLDQASTEASDGKIPLIIFKRNRHKPMALLVAHRNSDFGYMFRGEVWPSLHFQSLHREFFVCTLDALTEVDPVLLY
tara:strand:- start:434 stop:916 length:483 start_codon:yes stop_codon:yes gene_type:complete